MAYFIYKKIKIKQLRKDRNKKFKINDFKKKFKNLKKFQRNQIPKQNKSKGGDQKRHIKANIYKT